MKRAAMLVPGIVVILSTAAAAQRARHQVINAGDSVEIHSLDAPAPAPEEAPAAEPVLPADLTVTQLSLRFIEAHQPASQEAILERLARAKARNVDDARWLLNLYKRHYSLVRRAVEHSLALLSPNDKHLEPFFLAVLEEDDPYFKMFAILGALQLRSEPALPAIRKIAGEKFAQPTPTLIMNPKDANDWNVRFQALRALSAWRDPEALALLRKRAREAPPVARLIARHYWRESLEQIVEWSESRKRLEAELGRTAWSSPVPLEDLRATMPRLREIVLDSRKKDGTRHQAAIKLGLAATGEEVERLLKLRAEASNETTRLLLTTALFASRDPRVIPLLVEYVKTDRSPISRAGALHQLGGMMPPAEYRELLEWVAANDPDEENRKEARQRLAGE